MSLPDNQTFSDFSSSRVTKKKQCYVPYNTVYINFILSDEFLKIKTKYVAEFKCPNQVKNTV